MLQDGCKPIVSQLFCRAGCDAGPSHPSQWKESTAGLFGAHRDGNELSPRPQTLDSFWHSLQCWGAAAWWEDTAPIAGGREGCLWCSTNLFIRSTYRKARKNRTELVHFLWPKPACVTGSTESNPRAPILLPPQAEHLHSPPAALLSISLPIAQPSKSFLFFFFFYNKKEKKQNKTKHKIPNPAITSNPFPPPSFFVFVFLFPGLAPSHHIA